MWEMVRRKHELVEQAVSVQPHPAGDSSGTRKYALLSGINLEKPLTHTVTHSLSSLFSLQQYNYTYCPPEEHSHCHRGTAQYGVVFPRCTCDKGVEKY